MSITLSNATTQVRDLLNEDAATYWVDAEIERWIQEGCRIFSSKSLMVEGSGDIDPLIESQLSYSSSDESWIGDTIQIYAAILYNGSTGAYKGLIKQHPRQLGNVGTFTAGSPKYFSLHNRSIYIWPLTTAARVTAGDKITFLYAKETDDITALADEFQHLPILYSAAKCKMKDQKFAEANMLMQQFYQELNFERQDKHNRPEDAIDSFKIKKQGGPQGAR